MRKNILFFAALLCGTVSVNAEEAEAPEQEVEMAPEQEAVQTADTVVYVVTNPSAIEHSQGMTSAKYNYRKFVEEKGLRKWKKPEYLGNDTEPAIAWSANREGAYVAGIGQYAYFDAHNCFGGGLEIGYLRKYFGFSGYGTMGNGYEAKSSMRHKTFRETNVGLRIYTPVLEGLLGRDIVSLRVYAGSNFKKRQDRQDEISSSFSIGEIETDEGKGIETVTTVKTSRLDARPHVFGWEVGVRVQYDFWGSPLSIFATGDWGKSQNFSYLEKQWHHQTKFQIGISYRLSNAHSYNHELLKKLGKTPKQVKKHNL